jgi:hypothetical protein
MRHGSSPLSLESLFSCRRAAAAVYGAAPTWCGMGIATARRHFRRCVRLAHLALTGSAFRRFSRRGPPHVLVRSSDYGHLFGHCVPLVDTTLHLSGFNSVSGAFCSPAPCVGGGEHRQLPGSGNRIPPGCDPRRRSW